MTRRAGLLGAAVSGLILTVPMLLSQSPAGQDTVLLCDGKTRVAVPQSPSGRGQHLADEMMTQWFARNPAADWKMPTGSMLAAFVPQQATQNIPQSRQHEAYTRNSAADEFVRKTEQDKFIAEGKRIFHDADAFGGTVGVSCDMCHPDGSNTHAETYPKYQVQMQKVALLRDMINWCIEHPTKGKPLADDDVRLKAMEAYIMAQRKGKIMEPGKR